MEVKEIKMDQIKTLDNIRIRDIEQDVHTLMASIESYGMLQPIGVFGTEQKGYVIVWGNRRYVASKKLGLKKIAAVIVDTEDMTEDDFLIHNAIENIQRKEITTYELGKTCDIFRQKGFSIGEIAVKLSITNGKVRNALSDFNRIPIKYRPQIVYLKNNRLKGGKISSSVSNGILGVVKQHSLDKQAAEKLFDVAKKEEMTSRKLKLISIFMKKGLSVDEALKNVDSYDLKEIIVAVPKKELEALKKVENTNTFSGLMQIFFNEKFSKPFILNGGKN